MNERISEVLHVFRMPASMGTPCLQTGRAGFVINPEKGLTQCLNGCLDQWFFSQYCQCS